MKCVELSKWIINELYGVFGEFKLIEKIMKRLILLWNWWKG